MKFAQRGALAVAASLGIAQAASATQITISVTNDTGVDWWNLLFVIRPPIHGDDPPLDAGFDPNNQFTSKADATFDVIDQPINHELLFTFALDNPMSGDNEKQLFTLEIDNVPGTTFRVGMVPNIPGPGVLGMAGLVGLAACRRRR